MEDNAAPITVMDEVIRRRSSIDLGALPYLADHVRMGRIVLPAAAYLEMALATGRDAMGEGALAITEFRFWRMIFPEENRRTELEIVLAADSVRSYSFELHDLGFESAGGSSLNRPAARAKIETCCAHPSDSASNRVAIANHRARSDKRLSADRIYSTLRSCGIQYGASLMNLRDLWEKDGSFVGRVEIDPSLLTDCDNYIFHPAVLESAFQLAFLHANSIESVEPQPQNSHTAYYALSIGRAEFDCRPVPQKFWIRSTSAKPSREGREVTIHEVEIIDDRGSVFARFENLRLRTARESARKRPLPSRPFDREEGIRDKLFETSASDRLGVVERYVMRKLSQTLRIDGDLISPDSRLADLRLDSLSGLELARRFEIDFDVQFHPTQLLSHTTVAGLSLRLASTLARDLDCRIEGVSSDWLSGALWPGDFAEQHPTPPQYPKRNPSMAFILSSPRAGSTLLRVMLAGHPQLFAPPELHLLQFETMGERRRELDSISSSLAEGLPRAMIELSTMTVKEALEAIEKWEEEDISVQEVYRWIQDRAAPRTLVDKTPVYALSRLTVERGKAMFDGPAFLYLHRHPLAVIESLINLYGLIGEGSVEVPREEAFFVAEQIWTNSNSNCLNFLRDLSPSLGLSIGFEGLVREPERTIRQVCSFLQIPFDSSLLDPYGGARMLDGLREGEPSTGDLNIMNHEGIDPSLAEAWKKVQPPISLGVETKATARALGYDSIQ